MQRLLRAFKRHLTRHDAILVIGFLALLLGGLLAQSSASLAVGPEYGVGSYYFFQRQLMFALLGLVPATVLALLPHRWLKWLCVPGVVVGFALLVATLFMGSSAKGASRWLDFGFFNLQPSELLKPFLFLAVALVLQSPKIPAQRRGLVISLGLLAMVLGVLVLQPDVSTGLLIVVAGGAQLWVGGLPWLWLFGLLGLGGGVGFALYSLLPHVASRVERFLNPESGDTYQIDAAREAFLNGGLFGTGPGAGTVKHILPDAHTDFIFAVIGEEFGILIALLLLVGFLFVLGRGYVLLWARAEQRQADRFIIVAGIGLLTVLSLQVLLNIAVVLHVIPTTGMPLPFFSYGGSALWGSLLNAALVINLTREESRRVHR